MNEPQKAAYAEGYTMILKAFQDDAGLDWSLCVSLINTALSGDTSVASREQVVTRDENGEIAKMTTYDIRRNERAGYVLLGAFNAVGVLRAKLAAEGVTFTVGAAS
jgi:hypothetical protein